jgi:hypothetical protein
LYYFVKLINLPTTPSLKIKIKNKNNNNNKTKKKTLSASLPFKIQEKQKY